MRVPVVRRDDDDGVRIPAVQQLAIVFVASPAPAWADGAEPGSLVRAGHAEFPRGRCGAGRHGELAASHTGHCFAILVAL